MEQFAIDYLLMPTAHKMLLLLCKGRKQEQMTYLDLRLPGLVQGRRLKCNAMMLNLKELIE